MDKSILCIGLVCVDIITVCKDYPSEDTDQRGLSLHWQKGGNAANTSTVLANLGSKVEFIGKVPDMHSNSLCWGVTATKFVLEEMKRHKVDIDNIVPSRSKHFPTSNILVNKKNGSRTIVHHRGSLKELSFEDMKDLDLKKYSWIHFEGRPNTEVISKVMDMISMYNCHHGEDKVLISLELEKPRIVDLVEICGKADVVFISSDYARHLGYNSALETVDGMKAKLKPGAEIVCTWGSVGAAYATGKDGGSSRLVEAKAPETIVDTTGAGDAFLAGVVHSRCRGRPIGESVEFGCRVAERKISGFGFDHVKDISLLE